MTFKEQLPLYYEVDGDIFVKIFLDGDEIRAINHYGMSYEPFKAVYDGRGISKEEFEKAVLDEG